MTYLDHAFLAGIDRKDASFFSVNQKVALITWLSECLLILSVLPIVIDEFFIGRYSKIIYTSISHSH